ncbi:hypothetical protein NDU88_007695 [Pleurodeles waltl]|uniref:Uncharacterized protein n=1 Tax=Pleurodeles waltl TaxID=8319 RepID=A0AAV7N728_PLEWA|nr:hypothetical protein NDU88_007695 [Pleurodeles waltl]
MAATEIRWQKAGGTLRVKRSSTICTGAHRPKRQTHRFSKAQHEFEDGGGPGLACSGWAGWTRAGDQPLKQRPLEENACWHLSGTLVLDRPTTESRAQCGGPNAHIRDPPRTTQRKPVRKSTGEPFTEKQSEKWRVVAVVASPSGSIATISTPTKQHEVELEESDSDPGSSVFHKLKRHLASSDS